MQGKGKVGADVDTRWKSSCDYGMSEVDIFPSVDTTHGYSGRHHQSPSLRPLSSTTWFRSLYLYTNHSYIPDKLHLSHYSPLYPSFRPAPLVLTYHYPSPFLIAVSEFVCHTPKQQPAAISLRRRLTPLPGARSTKEAYNT